MARLNANISTAMYNIRKFRGLNEAEGGDTTLKDGEASVMRNFRVTDGGALTPRPVLKYINQLGNAAGADELGRKDVSLGETESFIFSENWKDAEHALNLYSAYKLADGKIEMSGELVFQAYSGTEGTNSPPSTLNDKAYCKIGEKAYLFGGVVQSNSYILLKEIYPTAKVETLWSGYVGGNQLLFAVANRCLWMIFEGFDGEPWVTRLPGANLGTGAHIFGFGGKLYILTGEDYLCYDGEEIKSVEGYVPCVLTACTPSNGSGTAYERINNLTLKRKCRYNADGTSTVYKVLEEGALILEVAVNNTALEWGTDFTVSESQVTFASAPPQGVENVEITYRIPMGEQKTLNYTVPSNSDPYAVTIPLEVAKAERGAELAELAVYIVTGEAEMLELVNSRRYFVINNTIHYRGSLPSGTKIRVKYRFRTPREQVLAMKHSELYNGANENRVFLYGDGTNKVIYSGLDESGEPTAEYFPDLNECSVGNDTSPITAIIKHYNRLLVFKDNEAYSIYTNLVSLADGSVTAGFYVSSINKSIGCCAEAQAVLVENRVRTLDGMDIYEWRATSNSGNITLDQRNASRVSQRVHESLSMFDLSKSILFYDKERHEFYCVYDGKAIVQNIEADAWYYYDNFPVTCMTVFNNMLVCGLSDGRICVMDETIETDFETEWASGSLDFDKPFAYKLSTQIWAHIRPENARRVNISVETENGSKLEKCVNTSPIGTVKPTLTVKLKPQKFIRYKLGLEAKNRLTVLGANIVVSYSTNVK